MDHNARASIVASAAFATALAGLPGAGDEASADEPAASSTETFDPGERIRITGQDGTPLPGDYNGDGFGDVLFYNPGPTDDPVYYGTADGSFGSSDRSRYVVNGAHYRPTSGDFDGNGVPDIFWYAPGTASDYYWLFQSDGTYVSSAAVVNGTYTTLVADFDANGLADIFWYGPGPAADYVWFNEAAGYRSQARTVNGVYTPLAGDFDGDGVGDITWYAAGTAADYVWYLAADGSYQSVPRTINGAYAPFSGDFDGDGVSDIFWYAPGAAADYVWYYANDRSYQSQRASQSGDFRGTAVDYNGDGIDEIFWAGTAYSESWTESPDRYWWSDDVVAALTVTPEGPRTGYDRALFEHWISHGSGCDTREIVLRNESRTRATVDGTDCSVDAGQWLSYFDDVSITSAPDLDVDHLVPLAEAWDSGASTWSPSTRRDFANDLGVDHALVAVTASSNRSKSDRDPAEWKPPATGTWCRYASEWVSVKDRWDLTADQAEGAALDSMLRGCTSDELLLVPDPGLAPVVTSSPTPTPTPTPTCSTEGDAYLPANGGCIDRYDADANRDINCSELPAEARPVTVRNTSYDPYGLDRDDNGVGCE